jgi:hypothetical protein
VLLRAEVGLSCQTLASLLCKPVTELRYASYYQLLGPR